MSEVRYGPVIGNYNTVMLPVTASQKFHPNGGAFVFLDSNGRVSIALSATEIVFGWALVPRSLVTATEISNGYWTSSSTEGGSEVPVIVAAMSLGVTFRIPCGTGLGVVARCGEAADFLLASNNGTVQKVDVTANPTHDVVLVVAIPEDGDTNSLLVTFNPNEIQRDT